MTTAEQPDPPDPLDDLDRKLVAELAAGTTVAEAAVAAGCSPTTAYRRSRRVPFRAALTDARRSQLAVPAAHAVRLLPLGMARLERLIADAAAPPSAVIRAVEAVANIACRLLPAAAPLEGDRDALNEMAAREARRAARRAALAGA
jgi:hypothetical protein